MKIPFMDNNSKGFQEMRVSLKKGTSQRTGGKAKTIDLKEAVMSLNET